MWTWVWRWEADPDGVARARLAVSPVSPGLGVLWFVYITSEIFPGK